jgi:hypothetical protein
MPPRTRNANLHQAKTERNDEFYTQYEDINKEVQAYLEYDPNVFRGKTVYCNCDDPYTSNFFKFFAIKFNSFGLRRLIAASYDPSPIAGTQLPFEEIAGMKGSDKRAYVFDATEMPGNLDDTKRLMQTVKEVVRPLEGNGDFRSAECIELLKQADIVVTNPPFSLFREYIAQLVEYGKQFLIIGNMNAITYKEVFPLIKENKVWLGLHNFDNSRFDLPTDSVSNGSKYWELLPDGHIQSRVSGVRWFTNLGHGRRHQALGLMTMQDNLKFNNHRGKITYSQYDNYDAIEVPFIDAIPSDYEGVMGVPISFLDKYNPEQFEILGATQRGCHDEVPDTRKYDDYWEVKPNGEPTGASGGKTNENANLVGNDGKKNYFLNKEGRIIQSAYQRIFIRHKKGK